MGLDVASNGHTRNASKALNIGLVCEREGASVIPEDCHSMPQIELSLAVATTVAPDCSTKGYLPDFVY